MLQSEFAEVAVYDSLAFIEPTYAPFLSDLYSINQLGQEFSSFDHLFEDWRFKLQFGSSLQVHTIGGSNLWPDRAADY